MTWNKIDAIEHEIEQLFFFRFSSKKKSLFSYKSLFINACKYFQLYLKHQSLKLRDVRGVIFIIYDNTVIVVLTMIELYEYMQK